MSVGPIGRGAASLLAGLGFSKVGPGQGPVAPRPPVDGIRPFPRHPGFQQRYQQDSFEDPGQRTQQGAEAKKSPVPMPKPKPKKPAVRPPPKPILGAAFKPAVVGGQVQMERRTMGERRADVPSNVQQADDGTTAQMMVQLAQKM